MLSQSSISISKISENIEDLSQFDTIIKGPDNTPIFLNLNSHRSTVELLDIRTRKKTILSHKQVKSAIGIDNDMFATASIHSIKFWRFADLSLVNEFQIFDKKTPWPYVNDGQARSIQLLPNKVLVAFLSTGLWEDTPEKVFSTVFAIDIATGIAVNFNLSVFKKFMWYAIAAIPHQINQFVIYDEVHGKDFYIFEINWMEKRLNLIAKQEQLNEGAFYKLSISPNGLYWVMDMRYRCSNKPIFGTQVYTVDSKYNLTCIAKMFDADKPQWNGNNLFYSYEDQICEFNLKNFSHTIITKKLSFNAKISPCFADGYYQVMDNNNWETYNKHQYFENYSKEWSTHVDYSTKFKFPTALIKLIGEYLDVENISSKVETFKPELLSKFGILSLFKKPSENELIDVKPQNKKSKLNHCL